MFASTSPAAAVAAIAASYLLGTFPTAVLVGRRRGVDPTVAGSRNPGATNILRTAGRRAGALTLVVDVAKGAVAAGFGWLVGGHALGLACGIAAVIGHIAPVTRGFRGGKGVATAAGMALVLYPWAAAIAAAGFGLVAAVTRVASLASIVATALLPLAAALAGAPAGEVAALGGCAAVIVARHHDNIVRLVHGEERRIGTPRPI